MAPLPDDIRTRLRATALTLTGALVLVGILLALWAVLVGFDVTRTAPVVAVAPVGEQDLLVEYTGGSPGCGDPAGVEVAETSATVEVTAHVVIPFGTRWNFSCDDVGSTLLKTVRLDAPLGGRAVVDASGAPVAVREDAADLVGGQDP